MSELVVDHLSVRFGDRVAVEDVSFLVPSGDVLALLGPSGCGKSTLLRAIAGLEPLSQGTVHLAGTDLAGVPTHRRGIGLMFQEPALFAHLDVAGNVAFGLRMHRWAAADQRSRVAQMLELVGLGDRGGDAVDELSGGERQRVSLARTLAPRPRVVLLDEPLGALDQVLRRDMLRLLGQAFAVTGATALYVTHDPVEATALADRIALMRAGALVQVGTMAQLTTAPADPWVSDFLS